MKDENDPITMFKKYDKNICVLYFYEVSLCHYFVELCYYSLLITVGFSYNCHIEIG
jgi:hypothetical protein